jgi:hypothetical protein
MSGIADSGMPKSPHTQPPVWRVAAAFAIAPLAASLVYALMAPAYAGLPRFSDRVIRTAMVYLFGAYPQSLLLGVPALLALRKRLRPTPVTCGLVGAIIASAPWLILGMLTTADYSYDDGHVTAVHGQKTFWGWVDLADFTGQLATLGALGGVVFWMIAAAGRRPANSGPI